MPIPKPNKGESQQAFHSRCMGDPVMVKEYEQAQRNAVCYQAWKDKDKKPTAGNQFHGLVANIDTSNVRTSTYKGRKYYVSPVVMAVECVMNDLFYPEDQLAKYTGAWNMRPVTLYHPKAEDGLHISANDDAVSPEVILGMIRNTKFDDKLRAEAWLDIEHTKTVRPEILDYYEGKRTNLEVSTGLWGDVLPVAGEYNGEKYVGIMTNIRPDHLALLPDGEGACNWEKGCGLRANEEEANKEIPDSSNATTNGPGEAAMFNDNNQGGNLMNKEIVDKLIACSRCKYQEKDREWLMTLNEEQLDLISPPDNVVLKVEEEPPAKVDINQQQESPKDAMEWLQQQNAPARLMETIQEAILTNTQAKVDLASAIAKHPKNLFTQEQLMAKPVSELKALHALVQPVEAPPAEESGGFFGLQSAMKPPAVPAASSAAVVEPMVVESLEERLRANIKK